LDLILGQNTVMGLLLGQNIVMTLFELDSNVFVSNALIDVYTKCERMEDSISLFELSKDHAIFLISFNLRIAGVLIVFVVNKLN